MGVYRSRIEAPGGEAKRFKLLLYAELPDRVHAEILSPVGTTEVILDGGGGRIAVTLPRERVAYVGTGDTTALEQVLGLSLTLEQLVQALLGAGSSVEGLAYVREPPGTPGLPREFEIESAGNRLRMRLERTAPLRVSTAEFGNGEPPAGVEQRPLEALRDVALPEDAAGGGPS